MKDMKDVKDMKDIKDIKGIKYIKIFGDYLGRVFLPQHPMNERWESTAFTTSDCAV